jgi:hypothetical protein
VRKYFYTDGVSKFGPYSIDELLQKGISRDTKVWFLGLSTWTSFNEIEELNEARRKLAHSFPLKPSEKRSADNIERMNRGDFSVPPGGSVRVRSSRKNEPEEKKPTGKRRRTNMSDVIVAHYLFDEGYADSLDGAEVMAESISDNWVQSILSESDIEPPKERLVTDRNMFNISQEERNAARERTLAKAKAAREKKKNR